MNIYASLYFRNRRSEVTLCHKNGTKVTGVCEQQPYILDLSSLIFVALQKKKLFSVVWTVNLALVKYHRIQLLTKRVFNVHLGTLSEDNDDNSENVYEKINLRSFKLIRVYLDPLDMSNAGNFSWSWILKDFIQVQKEEGKFVVVCPRPP